MHTEYRDDRFVAAIDREPGQSAFFSLAYVVRAVAPGLYVYPPATAEDMYRADRFGRTAFGEIEVTAQVSDALAQGHWRAVIAQERSDEAIHASAYGGARPWIASLRSQ